MCCMSIAAAAIALRVLHEYCYCYFCDLRHCNMMQGLWLDNFDVQKICLKFKRLISFTATTRLSDMTL